MSRARSYALKSLSQVREVGAHDGDIIISRRLFVFCEPFKRVQFQHGGPGLSGDRLSYLPACQRLEEYVPDRPFPCKLCHLGNAPGRGLLARKYADDRDDVEAVSLREIAERVMRDDEVPCRAI